MEQLVDKIAKTPWPKKLGGLVGAIVGVTAVNFFLLISPSADQISATEKKLKTLEADFNDKQQIANNLNQYRQEKESLEQRLAEALTELPNEAALDELLRQIDDVGIKSGLEIESVEPGGEQPEKFFARIPVKMKVIGNFHEIAVFFDSVGKLKRIVNISEIVLQNPQKKNEKIVLEAEYLATTFRFLPEASGGTAEGGGDAAAAGAAPAAPAAGAPPPAAPPK